jgi:hypothetical protein
MLGWVVRVFKAILMCSISEMAVIACNSVTLSKSGIVGAIADDNIEAVQSIRKVERGPIGTKTKKESADWSRDITGPRETR